MATEDFREEVQKLTKIGIALTSMHDLDALLQMIVRETRTLTRADAGSLYLRENDRLRFVVSQNDTLKTRLGAEGEKGLFTPYTLPLNVESIAGYVASTKLNVNLKDVYDLPASVPFGFNPDFDRRNSYKTASVLAVPMLDQREEVLGVLQLINAKGDQGHVVAFDSRLEDLVRSLASQAAVAVSNARLTSEIKKVHLDTIYRLSVAAEYRDHDTGSHVRRMSHYSAALARRLGWDASRVELMLYASPMHDVGKIGISDAILQKPGKLTPEERGIMQKHTEFGARILSGSDSEILKISEVIALSHHEKWDGTGYPLGLRGDQIPEEGRIVAVADVFDALHSKRVYKGALGFEESVQMIVKDAGTHFDPRCADAFAQALEEIKEISDRFKESVDLASSK